MKSWHWPHLCFCIHSDQSHQSAIPDKELWRRTPRRFAPWDPPCDDPVWGRKQNRFPCPEEKAHCATQVPVHPRVWRTPSHPHLSSGPQSCPLMDDPICQDVTKALTLNDLFDQGDHCFRIAPCEFDAIRICFGNNAIFKAFHCKCNNTPC